MAKTKEDITASKELAAGLKNFRMSDDIQNFFRFIHENDLRKEAQMLLKTTIKGKKKTRKRKVQ